MNCWRCNQPAVVERLEITSLGDPGPRYIRGRVYCRSPGCVDFRGTQATSDQPPSPDEFVDEGWRVLDAINRIALEAL